MLAAMETPEELSARARSLQARAECLSEQTSGGMAELNHWMGVAKAQRLTWIDGLSFSIKQMQSKPDAVARLT
jgi:hypothetical protein